MLPNIAKILNPCIDKVLAFFSRISSKEFGPGLTHVEDGCESNDCFQGAQAEELFLLKSKLNFTLKIVKGSTPGFERKNGSWTGQIGELIFLVSQIV